MTETCLIGTVAEKRQLKKSINKLLWMIPSWSFHTVWEWSVPAVDTLPTLMGMPATSQPNPAPTLWCLVFILTFSGVFSTWSFSLLLI